MDMRTASTSMPWIGASDAECFPADETHAEAEANAGADVALAHNVLARAETGADVDVAVVATGTVTDDIESSRVPAALSAGGLGLRLANGGSAISYHGKAGKPAAGMLAALLAVQAVGEAEAEAAAASSEVGASGSHIAIEARWDSSSRTHAKRLH